MRGVGEGLAGLSVCETHGPLNLLDVSPIIL